MQKTTRGWLNGLIGVVFFSGSLPATRVAVMGFPPLFLTGARATIAAGLAFVLLRAFQVPKPDRNDLVSIAIVAVGCVLAFPLLTALALQHITSAHSMIFIGALPLTTAIFAVLRNGERPRPAFWLFSVLGACLIGGYALSQGSSGPALGDFLMLGAIVTCGLGYAEGARLSRKLGGWQVISWALVFSVPVMLPLTIIEMPSSWHEIGFGAWIGLAYVSIFSMLVGFVFWYRGLDQGSVAAVAQLQLLQPFLGLALAAWLLHEPVTPLMQVTAAAVVLCVAGARKFAPNSPSTPRGAGAVPQSPAADDASPRRGAGGTGGQATTTNTPRPDQAS